MKKKFVSAMVFSAMVLATTPALVSCSDYDDDIDNLQEQVDKINGSAVSPADLEKAVSEAKAEYEELLQQAVSGKADNEAVVALQEKVNALNAALENKADAEAIATLTEEIAGLKEQVNSVEGDLDKTKTELQSQIDALKEQLGSGDGEDAEGLAQQLTELQNKLQAVESMASDNAGAIAQLTEKISALDKLQADIDGYADRLGKVESGLNDKVSVQDLADKLAAIKVEMEGAIDTKLEAYVEAAELTGKIQEQLTLYYTKGEIDDKLADLETLKKFKQDVLDKVFGDIDNPQDIKSYSELLASVAELEDAFGKGGEIEAINKALEELQTKYNGLVGNINAMIQSIVYMPEYADREVQFRSLYLQDGTKEPLLVSGGKTQTIQFRVSPIAAAKDFNKNYTVSFDGGEIKSPRTRSLGEENPFIQVIGEPSVNEATGVVTVTALAGESMTKKDGAKYASLCMQVVSNVLKDDEDNDIVNQTPTNITSDYFTMNASQETIKDVQVTLDETASTKPNRMLPFNDNTGIDYKTNRKFIGTTTDGNLIDLAAYDLTSVGTVTYEFVNEADKNSKFFSLADGVLKIKEESQDASSIGQTTQVKAIYKFNVSDMKFIETKYKKVEVDKYIKQVEYKVNNGAEFASKWIFNKDNNDFTYTIKSVDLVKAIGTLSPNEYLEMIKQDPTETKVTYENGNEVAFFTVDKTTGDVTLTIKANKNMAHVAKDKNVVSMKWSANSELVDFTITANIATTTIFPEHTVAVDEILAAGNKATIAVLPTLEDGKLEKIEFDNMETKSLFNFEEVSPKVTADKGLYTVKAAAPKKDGATGATGVTVSGSLITIDKAKYNYKNLKEITATGTIDFDTNYEGENSQEVIAISVPDLSGSWSMEKNTFSFSSKKEQLNIAKGCVWKDYYENVMWKDGKAIVGKEVEGKNNTAYAVGITGLNIYGLQAPKFTFATENNPNAKFFKITENGVITWNGGDFEPQTAVDVKVIVTLNSQWSEDGVEGKENNTITVTFPTGLK